MSNTDTIVILIAFAAYLMLMIVIGAIYMKNTNNSEDYFLGGRGLSGWVAALSAQASDMSGWLLMGLPGTVYALGTGQSWDRDRTVSRNSLQLGVYFFTIEKIYDQGK